MLRNIKDYPEEYRKVYGSYEKFSQKGDIVKRFIDEEFTDILNSSQFKIDVHKAIRILSIGSGSGIKDIYLLHKLRKLYPNNQLEVTVVEPCKDYIDEYRTRLDGDDIVKGYITVDWICKTSEEYQNGFCSENEISDSFNFVVLFEVLYYEVDLEKALCFYMSRVDRERGLVLVALNIRDTSWSRMYREFSFFEGSGACPIGVEDVEERLNKLGFQFETFIKKNPYQLDFVFEKDNPDGDNVLSHWSHVVNLREEGTPDQIQFYENLVKKHSRHEDGHFYFDTDIGIIVIRKV